MNFNKIFTALDVEKLGNSIMAHHKLHLYVRNEKPPDEIEPSHSKDQVRLKRVMDAMNSGIELPPILIDECNMVMDGNHRLYAHKELKKDRIKVFQAVGRLNPDLKDFMRKSMVDKKQTK